MMIMLLFCLFLQVVGSRSVRAALSARPHLVFRLVLLERLVHRHGLPLHRLQHTAGDVHLHLPLSPSEEGKDEFIAPLAIFKGNWASLLSLSFSLSCIIQKADLKTS